MSPKSPSTEANRINRRRLLAAAGVAGSFLILPRHVLAGAAQTLPSEKLNIAGIGLGMGLSNLQNISAQDAANIVALCDVDPQRMAQGLSKYPKAKPWSDYREMLDKQKDIDAVVVATPDHTHAVICMAAIRAGKHVYCQKPLCHDIHEARVLAKAAAESKVATVMGIQGHSMEGLRLICEWIWDGAIGEVTQVEAWCSLSYYPWGHAAWSSKWGGGGKPADTPPVPKDLNWDLWLGPAPERAYHPAYHPAVWRCWWDFGCGMMGDRGAHTLDPVATALKLGPPLWVEATSCGLNDQTHPLSAIVTFQFAARQGMPPVKLTWYEGTRPPRPPELEEGRQMPAEGGAIRGSKGVIMAGVYGNSPRLIPETAMKSYKLPAKTLPRIQGSHETDWIAAAKEGRQPEAHFGYSGPLTETCLLGNIAKRVDGRIEWDAANMKITNNPKANEYVRAQYRKGWAL